MRKQSDLDAPMHRMLAILQEPEREEEVQTPDEEEQATIHVYPVAGGGILFSQVPLDAEEPTIIDSEEPYTEIPLTQHSPRAGKEPPCFLHFLLILCFFVLFDVGDGQVSALLAPIATITITPQVQTLATTATLLLASLQGRVLPALTLAQTQRVQATGQGHQDAQRARGTLTLYNGLFTSQSIPAGTIFTGGHGVQVATDEAVTIAAGTPPSYAVISVPAHALQAGSRGNIGAGEVTTTVANGVLVRNAPFTGGSDARDFVYVTRADIQHGSDALVSWLVQSEQAALAAHLQPHEVLSRPTCTTQIVASHQAGAEAASVEVAVTQTCWAVVVNRLSLQTVGMPLLEAQGHLGKAFRLNGVIEVSNLVATIQPQGTAILTAHLEGLWVYQVNAQQVKALIVGKPRLTALHLLSGLPGVQAVSIAGISDNEPVPEDVTHLHC